MENGEETISPVHLKKSIKKFHLSIFQLHVGPLRHATATATD